MDRIISVEKLMLNSPHYCTICSVETATMQITSMTENQYNLKEKSILYFLCDPCARKHMRAIEIQCRPLNAQG